MLALGQRKVVSGLQVQPKSRIDGKKSTQTNGGVGGHVSPLANDVGDAVCGHTDRLRERTRRQAERLEIFLGKDFAGMRAQSGHGPLRQ
jgi:hypothetical protein